MNGFPPESSLRNRRLAAKLSFVVVVMFGFGFALVPLYDVFCDITGLNGKTGRISAGDAAGLRIARDRNLVVELVTNIAPGLPWEFRANQSKVVVHPGQIVEVTFTVRNHSEHVITGQAVPSIAPGAAARYFNKTECFCFTRQRLAPGETRTLPVRFVVTTEIPDRVAVLTLAYTFFRIDGGDSVVLETAGEG